jgi:hypothetical protein
MGALRCVVALVQLLRALVSMTELQNNRLQLSSAKLLIGCGYGQVSVYVTNTLPTPRSDRITDSLFISLDQN